MLMVGLTRCVSAPPGQTCFQRDSFVYGSLEFGRRLGGGSPTLARGLQVGSGTHYATGAAHALLWSSQGGIVDLHPSGVVHSYAHSTDGFEQVGSVDYNLAGYRAALWRGSAASFINLHPPGYTYSYAYAYGVHQGEQVGEGDGKALIWHGTPTSVVNLGPGGAQATNGSRQIGFRSVSGLAQAMIWAGTANTALNIHPTSFRVSLALAIDTSGDIAGYATDAAWQYHAMYWRSLCQDTDNDGNADDDGDALCDNWETNGIDMTGDGVSDFRLPGADQHHKDLYIELDYLDAGGHSHRPTDAALAAVVSAFANAPVVNPDGSSGIRLHLSMGDADAVPETQPFLSLFNG